MTFGTLLATGLALLISAATPTRADTGQATHAQGPSLTLRTDDYPRDAREKGETGRAVVRFLVNAQGRVHECSVVESSGSTALDATTCNIARRGRFKPARDANGAPRSEYWRWGVDWQLPSSKPSISADYAAPEDQYARTRGMLPAAAADIDVVVGTANWAAMPGLPIKRYPANFGGDANVKVGGLLANKACRFRGARSGGYDIDVRYALRLDPDGRVSRGLVEDVGCPPLQQLVASMVLGKAFLAAIEPPGGSETRWYRSMLRFSGQ